MKRDMKLALCFLALLALAKSEDEICELERRDCREAPLGAFRGLHNQRECQEVTMIAVNCSFILFLLERRLQNITNSGHLAGLHL